MPLHRCRPLHRPRRPDAPLHRELHLCVTPDGARFKRLKDGIEVGRIKPSLRAIYAVEGASQEVARRYLLALEQRRPHRAGRAGQGLPTAHRLNLRQPITRPGPVPGLSLLAGQLVTGWHRSRDDPARPPVGRWRCSWSVTSQMQPKPLIRQHSSKVRRRLDHHGRRRRPGRAGRHDPSLDHPYRRHGWISNLSKPARRPSLNSGFQIQKWGDDRLTFEAVELLALVQLPHCEGSGNRRTTELIDHHEDMRALDDDFMGLALVEQQGVSLSWMQGLESSRQGSTVQKPCTSGYMTSQKRKSPVAKPGQVVDLNGRACRT
ncbi:hypothetical protein [Malikia sp.]|uniref:hypothetical protein n=1 Tax=Malikia sp. TaxID=2070706 RepID=UPI00262C818A|nr:hypothetical protein [Malikia sp.]